VSESTERLFLRRKLEAHLAELGYSGVGMRRAGAPIPELVRVSPVRGRIVYGETVLHADLRRKTCHERLLFFSQRRTRHRSSILFFIGVAEADVAELDALLEQLDIRSGTRGGHVHVIAIALPAPKAAAGPKAPRKKAASAAK
jgi:hypothetical protein